jgi:uncharacterized GH25 family protein
MPLLFCLAALLAVCAAQTASAHDIWATAENPAAGQPMTAILGYGHHFPNGEVIAAERVSIFYPLEVINSKGEKLPLKPGDANYKFLTESPVENGTYLITTGYKPTFWSYTPAGSAMKPKNETPGATSCEQWYRYAKGVVNIGGVADNFVTKPIGVKLELVPETNPGALKVGQPLVVQALLDGQPVKGNVILGTYAGNELTDDGNRDFYTKTNNEGKFTFVPIAPGLWTLMVEVLGLDYPDKAVCDTDNGDATLTFQVN